MGVILVVLALLGIGATAWLGWGGATEAELRRGAILIAAALLMLLATTLLVVGLYGPAALPAS